MVIEPFAVPQAVGFVFDAFVIIAAFGAVNTVGVAANCGQEPLDRKSVV